MRVILCLLALGSFCASAEETLDIHRFGKGGDLLPAHAGEFLSEGFFSQHQTRALMSDYNFTSAFQLKTNKTVSRLAIKPDTRERIAQVTPERELTLINPNPHSIEVVVSAANKQSGAVTNFLIPLAMGEVKELTLGNLRQKTDLYMISLDDFKAVVHEMNGGFLTDSKELSTNRPAKQFENKSGKTANSCSDATALVLLRSVVDGTTIGGILNRDHFISASGNDGVNLEYHYPYWGEIFHMKDGRGLYSYHEKCTTRFYSTLSVTYVRNRWFLVDEMLAGSGSAYICPRPSSTEFCEGKTWDIFLREF